MLLHQRATGALLFKTAKCSHLQGPECSRRTHVTMEDVPTGLSQNVGHQFHSDMV